MAGRARPTLRCLREDLGQAIHDGSHRGREAPGRRFLTRQRRRP
jgi:hypothetical protein